jgi:hypothetical protein
VDDVVAEDVGDVAALRCGHGHLDRRGSGDDVVVRQHLPVLREHDSRPGGVGVLEREVGVHHDDALGRRWRCRGRVAAERRAGKHAYGGDERDDAAEHERSCSGAD